MPACLAPIRDVAGPPTVVDADEMGRHILLLAALGFSGCDACDPNVLVETDAGVDAGFEDAGFRDAGFDDAGFADAGFDDAGFFDAGVDDAGFADAGFDCVFPNVPPPAFACEGDEDICDAVGEVGRPERDVLAVWSRIEDDEFVIDVRFAGFPFRRAPTGLFLQIETVPADDEIPPYEFILGPPSPSLGQVVRGEIAYEIGTANTYPPITSLDDASGSHVICGEPIGLGVEAPLLEFRWSVDFIGADPRYFIGVRSDLAPVTWDFVNDDPPPATFVTPRGGAPDNAGTFISFCDLDCPAAGGTLQPRED